MTDISQPSLFNQSSGSSGSVECLGITFENDEARRAYFLEKLREKLKDPEFRKIEGFPIGEDEDILALSDPPYYTACPNPFMEDFIEHYGKPYDPETDNYQREPFAADVSEGKNDPIYNAHSYHTKVPHKAIMRYILHYTEPGDVVLDGFCGTGMTGVAAQLCGDRATVESLGYKTQKDGVVLGEESLPISRLGERRTVLNDLSPAATSIAYNYNASVDVNTFENLARALLNQFETEYGWMYRTRHRDNDSFGRINYVVWSDVFLCNYCQGEVIFWIDAVEAGLVKEEIYCPHCSALVSKRSLDRAKTTMLDLSSNKALSRAKRVPVLINYSVGNQKFDKKPDNEDLLTLKRIEDEQVPGKYPTVRIDRDIDLWHERDYRSLGIYTIDAFFQKRSLIMISFFRKEIQFIKGRLRSFLWFWFQSVLMGFSLLNRYRVKGYSQVNQILSGTLYIGAVTAEISPWYALEGKVKRFKLFNYARSNTFCLATGSTSRLALTSNSVDYIFTDPPFGSNIIYSDLSILWESWLSLWTNTKQEAVVHRRKKDEAFTLAEYIQLMASCFSEMYRVLKPGRWITIEFSNTQASVWNAIQTALQKAGFVVANVSALDKQQGSFKAVTTTIAVKQDLVISAYKPSNAQEACLAKAPEQGVWEFIQNHLQYLPVTKGKRGDLEFISERDPRILYDRLIAYYVLHGYDVPLSSQDFQTGLIQRFAERDGMIFLPEQVAEYDRKRLSIAQAPQLDLFVFDERTSIDWLLNFLKRRPSTYQEIQPEFMQQLSASWRKYETRPELSELLRANCLCYDGQGDVPSQIHSYLSSNYKDMRNLAKDDPALVAKAKERWYVPDPNKAGDLEKLRERELLRQFETYQQAKQKQLKEFRLEALRTGFKKAWQERNYQSIMDVGRKIPEATLQEDEKLLMYYDQSVTRIGEDD
ncbi:MAG: site-specific DNA-methyltransferase [Leptolyngbya sp. Prado105]|nr:site-specific DNA-methyltransferase [Leptolyngbya sp. Prado105]